MTLPPELIDIIIDHLHSDRRALAACSLVCKTWRLSARHHLFARLALNLENANSNNPDSEFLRIGSDIIPFAHHIHLNYILTSSGPGQYVPRPFSFNGITSLGLTIGRPIDHSAQIATLLYQFAFVVRLELHHIQIISFYELMDFISAFPRLEILVMNEVKWERDSTLTIPLTLRFHALHLDGGMDGREKAHMLLLLSLNGVSLRSLYLTSIGNYDIENLNALLQVVESSLEEFWCSIEPSVFPPIFAPYHVHIRNLGFACPDRHPVIDLRHNSWLRLVLVHVYVSHTTWVAQMLSLITSERMAKLSIVIRAGPSQFDRPDSSGWRGMDAVLTQAQFATLERIEIICDWKDVDVAAWFSALLPQCRARDALKFVTELPEFPSV